MTVLDVLSKCISVVCFVGAVAFVVRFLRTGWSRTEMGRHMMAFMAVSALILGQAVVFSFLPPLLEWVRDVLRMVNGVSLAWVIWWRYRILVRAQRDVAGERLVEERHEDNFRA